MENAVEIKNVSMKFRMTTQKVDSIKEFAIRKMKKQLHYVDFMALDNISFNVGKGEVVGIIGLNGSGKSTTLKLISGILKPTEGTVKVNGNISPLIELGAGFDYELTARENVFLNGSVLGFSHAEMENKMDEIIEFSELGDFMDTAIKNFSSGMLARLGFSIATNVRPEILIVDEILGVGDFLFQQKCEKRINDMMSGGTTVIIVSHSIDQIKRLCDRVVWLDKGKVKLIGETQIVCNEYSEIKK
ncbi:MAG: ABC transporter ATP-binding protein [Oscillospiraceae bacterium]|nr:ABC transporter ATP-binding protein [Oscillospiraceae bacterium]MDY2862652.1 ABC transporter ATP-binding protein [Oscillospiraceae bacterium]